MYLYVSVHVQCILLLRTCIVLQQQRAHVVYACHPTRDRCYKTDSASLENVLSWRTVFGAIWHSMFVACSVFCNP